MRDRAFEVVGGELAPVDAGERLLHGVENALLDAGVSRRCQALQHQRLDALDENRAQHLRE